MNDKVDFRFKAAVITISDTRSQASDVSGRRLAGLLWDNSIEVVASEIITDDLMNIRERLYGLCENGEIDLILTTGGTGFSPRDNTPEATRAVIEREAPGLAEAMRMKTLTITPTAMLSRGVCGIREKTLIINMPGSPKAVEECFAVIQPVLLHALRLIKGDTDH